MYFNSVSVAKARQCMTCKAVCEPKNYRKLLFEPAQVVAALLAAGNRNGNGNGNRNGNGNGNDDGGDDGDHRNDNGNGNGDGDGDDDDDVDGGGVGGGAYERIAASKRRREASLARMQVRD
jgi:hypothetical protein